MASSPHPHLESLADFITKRRGWILAAVIAATVGLGSQIPHIQADPAPEKLIQSFEGGGPDVGKLYRGAFHQNDEEVMFVLVQAPDVLSRPVLQYMHELGEHFEAQPYIREARSITEMPMPRRVEPKPSSDNLEDLDSLDELDTTTPKKDAKQEATLDALLDLVESQPKRFPNGIRDLGPELSTSVKTDPIVQGPTVTDADAKAIAKAVESSPLLEGRLVSKDRKVAAIALYLAHAGSNQTIAAVHDMEAYLRSHPPTGDIEVHLGGLPYLRSRMVDNMRSDQIVLLPLALLVCMALLWLSFRWLPGVVLPIAAVLMTVVIVMGGMAVTGQSINALTNIIPVLLIIIGISDGIHLVGRYREEVARVGPERAAEADQRTVRTMAVACFLTSATTAIGLGSLAVSNNAMLRDFGLVAGLGVMVAYIVTITFVPASLGWVRPPPPPNHDGRGGQRIEGLTVMLTERVLRHPWAVMAVTAALLLGMGYVGSKVRIDHALLDQFDKADPVYVTTRLMERELSGVRPLEVVLTGPPGTFSQPKTIAALDAVREWGDAQPAIISSMSYDDLLRQTYALITNDSAAWHEPFDNTQQVGALVKILRLRKDAPLGHWLTANESQARLQFNVRDVGAQATMHFIDALEHHIDRKLDPLGIHAQMTGEAYEGSRGQEAVIYDLISSLLSAIGMIFVLLAVVFRSVRLGLLSIPPNLVPLVGTVAYMSARNIPLNAATAIIFSISIGLAVDGTIHVLSRFREETERGMRPRAALIRAARGTGRGIIVSCVTLMAGFGVLLMSAFVPVRQFGELIAVTVGLCLLATMIVQPALLKLAGLSRAKRREHRDEDHRIANALAARRDDPPR